VAVEAFVEGRIGFTDIWACVQTVMKAHANVKKLSLDVLIKADAWAREQAAAFKK
jgi:1-deoxy-D-xylulose 5-phosphate reductoisomerase